MAFDVAKPQQVILVTTRGKADFFGKSQVKDNIITLAWHMPLSFDPPLYGICVGKNRFSYRLIHESKVFCVNFIQHSMKDAALSCGTSTGANTDKFSSFSLAKDDCEHIDCYRLSDAEGWLECEVVDEFETGDHVVFVGKVHKEQAKGSGNRLFYAGDDSFTTTRL